MEEKIQNIVDRLQGVPTGNICDSNNKGGNMDAGLKALSKTMRAVGPAFTVRCQPGDNLTIHKAIYEAPPGSVLVIDAQGFVKAGAFGDILATACMEQGIIGVVLDGACRDANDLEEMEFPVFCRSTNPGGTVKESLGERNITIQCGGRVVRPGDWIIADRDGVAVVEVERIEDVVNKAVEKNQKEEEIRQKILEGHSTIELLGLVDKF